MEPLRVHRSFLGTDPIQVQSRLYAGFPEARGYSSKESSEARFEATFVSALAQTFDDKGGLQECLVLLPVTHVPWATTQMGDVSRRMFARWKAVPDAGVRAQAALKLGQAIKQLLVGSRVLQIETEPPRWVAFGFSVDDAVPEWLKKRLLSV